MSVKIENLTHRPVLLRLNSGNTLHISPSTTSKEILDVEVKNNLKVQKLLGQHIIALYEVKKEKPPATPKKEKAERRKVRKR